MRSRPSYAWMAATRPDESSAAVGVLSLGRPTSSTASPLHTVRRRLFAVSHASTKKSARSVSTNSASVALPAGRKTRMQAMRP